MQSAGKQQVWWWQLFKNLFRKERKQKPHQKLLKRMKFLLAQDYFVKADRFQFLMKFKILNRKN